VRAQPQRLQHEQEDAVLHADEIAMVLHAMRLSRQQADGSESDGSDGSDGSDDEAESPPSDDGLCDESQLVALLTEAERKSYDERREDEEKVGWTTLHSDVVQARAFEPPLQGPHPPLNGCTTPLDFFHAILPLTFWDFVVERMNAYAALREEQQKENRPPAGSTRSRPPPQPSTWTDTTVSEVQAFVGCMLCMGLVKMTNTKDYWRGDLGPPFLERTFARDRFLQLLRCFHLSDPSNPGAPGDRIHKIRHLNNNIIQQSQSVYYPGRHLTIDEAMVGFKGRTKLKQHIPAKSADTGFKIWMLVDCATNYVFNFEVYQGRGDDGPETGQSQRVVNHLVTPLEEQCWHIIGMDGFFSSVPLFESLFQRGIYAVATTRSWLIDFPSSLVLVNKHLREGQWLFRQRGNLVCTSWMDHKPVNLLSTYCDPLPEEEVQRWRRSSAKGRRDKRVRLKCPDVLVQYHHWMRGVDVWSQKESYYRIGRKSNKWWPRLAWFLIDMAVSNAYVLYARYSAAQPSPLTHAASQKAFRIKLMNELAGTFTARKKRGRPSHTPKMREDEEQHIPALRLPQRPCIVCAATHTTSRGGHKPRTTEGCETCGVAVHIACWKAHLPREAD
jgi:hypothetical protein